MTRTTHLRIIPIFLLLLIAMTVSGACAAFTYSEGAVEKAKGNAGITIADFNYSTGNGSFSSKDALLAYITDNPDAASQKYFNNSFEVTVNEDGSIALSTPANSASVMFTAEFIYELQQLGVKKIVINDFSVSNFIDVWSISYTDYTGTGGRHSTMNNSEWRIDISSPLLSPSGNSYVYTDGNGKEKTAQDFVLNTSYGNPIGNYSWNIGSMTFE